jgi:hypothetical protein
MASVIIADDNFRELIAKRAGLLLSTAKYLSQQEPTEKILTRPLLGELLSQSTQLEELLDMYGAGNNRRWAWFRSLTATMKLFSDVGYELLHIQHALSDYHLLPIEQDFAGDTKRTIEFTRDVLLRTATQILDQAGMLGLPAPTKRLHHETYTEQLPDGRLTEDRATRNIKNTETVTRLATSFLNLAAKSKLLHLLRQVQPKESSSCIPDNINEESLRELELQFHSLQSLYDTFVSGTATADIDADLPVMRGHISVVFHLLKTATAFAHYYERHVSSRYGALPPGQTPLVTPDSLSSILMGYSVNYAGKYLACAQRLCQQMLKRYAEISRIEVSVPQYRGFHVRPSTLVSQIVLHYGSDVKMKLGDESCNAAVPLEILRINEKINAEKRRWLAREIDRLWVIQEDIIKSDVTESIRNVLFTLAGKAKLIIYEQPLEISEHFYLADNVPLKQVMNGIVHLQAEGKIGIPIDMKVEFVGDKRVLRDLGILADSGYGEDSFGNNTPLPQELVYLQR